MKAISLNFLLFTVLLLAACGFKNTSTIESTNFVTSEAQTDERATKSLNKKTIKVDRVALIITISEYAPDSEWPNLNSNNDANLLKYALKNQGFLDKNIFVL